MAQGEGSPAARARETQKDAEESARIRELKARIAELETELETRLANAAAASTEASPPEPAPERFPTETVSTEAAGNAGLNARPGAAGETTIGSLVKLIEARDGAGLYRELEKFLTRGEAGFGVLYDFLRYLDRNRRTGQLFVVDYRNAFGLMHIAMLHDVELARFSHYYLNSTRDDPRSYTREQLYTFIPVFLKFYPARFPDLENAFREDSLRSLEQGKGDLRLLFGAIEALEFRPSIKLFLPRLHNTIEYRWIALLTDHLADRDSEEATRALVGYIRQKGDLNSREVRRAMTALARMTTVEAGRTVEMYLRRTFLQPVASGSEQYYSTLVLKYLDSQDLLKNKRNLLDLMRRNNPRLFEMVFGRLDEVTDDEAQGLVVDGISRL